MVRRAAFTQAAQRVSQRRSNAMNSRVNSFIQASQILSIPLLIESVSCSPLSTVISDSFLDRRTISREVFFGFSDVRGACNRSVSAESVFAIGREVVIGFASKQLQLTMTRLSRINALPMGPSRASSLLQVLRYL